MRRRWLSLSAVPLAVAILSRFPPDAYPIYPACPFRQCTGLLCPGCGATHALAAMLRGRWAEAAHDNALIMILLPLAILYTGLTLHRSRGGPIEWPRIPRPALLALALSVGIYGVARNLA